MLAASIPGLPESVENVDDTLSTDEALGEDTVSDGSTLWIVATVGSEVVAVTSLAAELSEEVSEEYPPDVNIGGTVCSGSGVVVVGVGEVVAVTSGSGTGVGATSSAA